METVSTAIKSLMRQEPYYGLFACGLNKLFDDSIPTACVGLNGINLELRINEKFWKEQTPDHRIGIIKHELLHICLEHLTIAKDYCDHERFNKAADYEVNSYIDKKYLPDWTLQVEKKKWEPRKGTRWYYNKLAEDPNEQEGGGDGDGQTLDDHSDFFKEFSKLTDTQKELVKKQIEFQMKETAKQVKKSKGNIPGELTEIIDRLFKIEPPVFNWKAAFRRLLGTHFDVLQKKTRRKESVRFEDCPGLRKKKKHEILVAIDTSGSVSTEEFYEFFSEIHHIHKAGAKIHIIEADMSITNEYDYNGKAPAKISGRGGTSFLECIDYYNKHRKDYTMMVYFTDGYGDQEQCKPNGEVVWIITSNGIQSNNFPGKVVHIPAKVKS